MTNTLTSQIVSLPALVNIASLVMLIFFIYAVVGVQLFAKVGNYDDANALTSQANFMSFPTATMTLLRMSTGEAWPDMMYDLSKQWPTCEVDPQCVTFGSPSPRPSPHSPAASCTAIDGVVPMCSPALLSHLASKRYDPSKCGFTGNMWEPLGIASFFPEGCADINGCGTTLSYPYWLSFEITMGFIMLNLIVFYILGAFLPIRPPANPLIRARSLHVTAQAATVPLAPLRGTPLLRLLTKYK